MKYEWLGCTNPGNDVNSWTVYSILYRVRKKWEALNVPHEYHGHWGNMWYVPARIDALLSCNTMCFIVL